MALKKDGLLTIVHGSESPADASQAKVYIKLTARRDHALAVSVLFIEPRRCTYSVIPRAPSSCGKVCRPISEKVTG